MRTLSIAELLRIWDQAYSLPPAQRALILLDAACPEMSLDTLATIPIGQRDALLMTLREQIFGSNFIGVTRCPDCRERLELNFDVADIREKNALDSPAAFTVQAGDYEVEFRLPNSLDLSAVEQSEDAFSARRYLLDSCILSLRCKGRDCPSVQLPEYVEKELATCMAQADPQADVQMEVACPACGHAWQAIFDIVSFFWSEISSWRPVILREVHLLASAYGWRENDILNMSSARRQLYLEMVGG
jgi:hypothetical protein